MSERLTMTEYRITNNDGSVTTRRHIIDGEKVRSRAWDLYKRLKLYEDACFDDPNEETSREIVTPARLRELAEAEREERLVVLPCKVGDTVFVLTIDALDGIEETKINRIVIKKNKLIFNADCKNDDWGLAAWELSISDFGKKWHLTRAEAARALAEKGEAT